MSKVLHIIPTIAQGGAEKVMIDVITRTPSHNHVVVLLEDVPDFYKLPAGVKVYRLGVPTKWRRSRLPLLWAKIKFAAVALRVRPSVVVGWSHVGMMAAAALQKVFGIKAVWSVHDSADPIRMDSAEYAERLAAYRGAKPDVIHYPSTQSREAHETRGVAKENGIVIPHVIDEAFLSVGEKRRAAWQTAAV